MKNKETEEAKDFVLKNPELSILEMMVEFAKQYQSKQKKL